MASNTTTVRVKNKILDVESQHPNMQTQRKRSLSDTNILKLFAANSTTNNTNTNSTTNQQPSSNHHHHTTNHTTITNQQEQQYNHHDDMNNTINNNSIMNVTNSKEISSSMINYHNNSNGGDSTTSSTTNHYHQQQLIDDVDNNYHHTTNHHSTNNTNNTTTTNNRNYSDEIQVSSLRSSQPFSKQQHRPTITSLSSTAAMNYSSSMLNDPNNNVMNNNRYQQQRNRGITTRKSTMSTLRSSINGSTSIANISRFESSASVGLNGTNYGSNTNYSSNNIDSNTDTLSDYDDAGSEVSSAITSDNFNFHNKSFNSQFDEEIEFTHQTDFIQLNELVSNFQICGFPIIVFDTNGTIEYLNVEAEELFGVLTFSILGEHLSEIFLEESVAEIHQLIEETMGSKTATNIYTSLSGQDKKEEVIELKKLNLMKIRTFKGKSSTLKKFFSVKGRFIILQKLNTTHFAGYFHPLSENLESKKEFASRKVAEAITDLSVIPIVCINSKGLILTFNASCSTTFGYQKKEVLGKNVKLLCNDKDKEKHDSYLKRYLNTGEKRVVDKTRLLKGKTKKGKSIRIELRVSEIIEDSNNESSFVGFIRDLSTMVTKEEQLTRLADKIFPRKVAQRISMGQQVIDLFDNCSILFCDIVGFTKMSNGKRPEEIVSILHEIFGSFDDICTAFQLEKVKTIGDCYFLVSGCGNKLNPLHADNAIKGGLAMIRVIQQFTKKSTITNNNDTNNELSVRIGIHSSNDIVAGVVGKVKQTYDFFGGGIERAQLIEATGSVNQLHVSQSCYKEIQSDKLKSLFIPHYDNGQEVVLEKYGTLIIPERTFITNL
ncbi:hypothetical protein ABK040_010740 [Willaertia magna]